MSQFIQYQSCCLDWNYLVNPQLPRKWGNNLHNASF